MPSPRWRTGFGTTWDMPEVYHVGARTARAALPSTDLAERARALDARPSPEGQARLLQRLDDAGLRRRWPARVEHSGGQVRGSSDLQRAQCRHPGATRHLVGKIQESGVVVRLGKINPENRGGKARRRGALVTALGVSGGFPGQANETEASPSCGWRVGLKDPLIFHVKFDV